MSAGGERSRNREGAAESPEGRRRAGVAFAALALALACGSGPDVAPEQGVPPEIAFPVQRAQEGERETMQALLHGTLVEDRACLRIQDEPGDERYVPIWPPAYSLRLAGDSVEVLDEKGRARARVGWRIRVSGGESRSVPETHVLPDSLGAELATRCPGPYWIVGGEVEQIGPPEMFGR